jgi:hypothetical protein
VFEGRVTDKDDIHVLWYEQEGAWKGLRVDNDLKCANHSPSPNVEVIGREVYALQSITAGEELVFHYGEDWD